jgi:tellurium resistance protein TerZ
MASISLEKGQTLSLEKGDNGLTSVFMGLGWDPAEEKKRTGLLGALLGGGGGARSIDLDASVIALDANKNVVDTVYFRKLRSNDGAIIHDGDNLTGHGDGDDEVINVDLARLSPAVVHLIFTVNAFSGQNFNDVANAEARLVDKTTGEEICKYVLTEQGSHTGVIMASVSKGSDGWAMTAHGVPGRGRTVADLATQAVSLV